MTTAVYTMPATTREMALRLIQSGYAVIPVPRGSKDPGRKGWQNKRVTAEQVPDEFNDSQNIGLLCGDPSDGLIDVDADAPEAIEAARLLLPSTGIRHGRPSKPHSHFW